MSDMAVTISRNFSSRHVDTLLKLISKASEHPDNVIVIRNELKKLPNHIDTFQKCHSQIMAHIDNANKQDQLHDEFDAFFEKVRCIELRCSGPPFTDSKPAVDDSAQFNTAFNNSHNRSECSVRLPKLTIPTFSGDIGSWCHFSDLFRKLVHENEELSDIEKLQYLKLNLNYEPLNLVKNLLVCSNNYQVAWDLLVKRYDNPRQIASHHVDNILAIPDAAKLSLPGLKLLVNTLNENIAALKMLQLPVDEWSFLLSIIVLKKLDHVTRQRFEETLSDRRAFTDFAKLTDFLEKQISILESLGSFHLPINAASTPKTTQFKRIAPHRTFITKTTHSIVCILCQRDHRLYKCPEFRSKPPPDRHQVTKSLNLCINCLDASHTAHSCPSVRSCFTCKRRHHTLLHESFQNSVGTVQSRSTTESEVPQGNPVTTLTNSNPPRSTVLLPTALVQIQDAGGKGQQIRVLLDCASQASYITESCMRRTRLRRRKLDTPIYALSEVPVKTARGITNCVLSPRGQTAPSFETTAIVVTNITGNIPVQSFDLNSFSHLKSITLSDPQVSVPAQVDMLLGADLFPHIVLGGRLVGPPGSPSALETVFGWVLMGQMNMSTINSVNTFQLMLETSSLEHILSKFWEVEEVTTLPTAQTKDEARCEKLYVDSVRRDASGRFSVALPFRDFPPSLGDSYHGAQQNLRSLQGRLSKNLQLKHDYNQFMLEYLKSGHMSLIKNPNIRELAYYIPHHCVLKPDSLTTKLRVVFNASRCTTNGQSLNDTLLIGEALQQNMVSILLRLRLHAVVLTADIRQMYRQIEIHPEHRKFQRILWSFDCDKPAQVYELNTVTYGLNCAPFLALRTLLQLAADQGLEYPRAARVIRQDTYVDDVITGCSTIEDAVALQQEISKLFRAGAFELRKWASNEPSVLSGIPAAYRQNPDTDLDFDRDKTIKVLGLCWNPSADYFRYKIQQCDRKCTKRVILSEIAKIFDPLGWLAPLTMLAKRIIQLLWSLALDWDAEPPSDIVSRWKLFQDQLPLLTNLRIARYIPHSVTFDLCGFCDASEAGYAAVVYSRTLNDAATRVIKLLCSKTRVAPLKRISLARLELCAALLLARLVKSLTEIYSVNVRTIYAWSDSTVALTWISSPSHRWKTFISNRVTEIQSVLPPKCWRHVPSQDNPADCASRGLLPSELLTHDSWWQGPPWLYLSADAWPSQCTITDKTDASEQAELEARTITLVATNDPEPSLLDRYSKLSKLQRITAYCFRFYNRLRTKTQPDSTFLTAAELNNALMTWVKIEQTRAFSAEIELIRHKRPCIKQIQKLNPILDESGTLRVGGRLTHAAVTHDKKYPILLPQRSYLTRLIIDHYHVQYLHPGPHAVHALISQKFWIISARNVIRHRLSQCQVCFRCDPNPQYPYMGNLPATRVTRAKPFQVVGLDYGGPFRVTSSCARGIKATKAYLCLFVCFATKALHLELVSSLSTDAFLAAFQRFLGRRGACSAIYSDCGTNFVGAKRLLGELFAQTNSKDYNYSVASALATKGIEWRLNPPSAPHFGGLWESGIKSVKKHLIRVVGEQVLTYEELNTVIIQIEALLNSRPLCPMSSDANDLSALTPGHFLVQEPLVSLPDPDYTLTPVNRLSRWQLTLQIHQHFWNRWHREYLNTLQQRNKWTKDNTTLTVGALVVVKDELQPPISWRLGRITALHPGSDNIVRVATVRTSTDVLRRPVVKLCVLPTDPIPN